MRNFFIKIIIYCPLAHVNSGALTSESTSPQERACNRDIDKDMRILYHIYSECALSQNGIMEGAFPV